MKHFDAKTVAKRLAEFYKAEANFGAASKGVDLTEAISEFRRAISKGINRARQYGFEATETNLARILKVTQAEHDPAALKAHADNASNTLRHDLNKHKFLQVPYALRDFVDQDKLFGPEVWERFPDARVDLRESGNCLAAECDTAAVFQLMRVVERGLRALARKVGATPTYKQAPIQLEFADWQEVIDKVKAKIKASRQITPGKVRDRNLTFYSDMAEQCEYFKDIYRNPVSHTRKAYDADEAIVVFNRARTFMQKLATDLRKVR